MCFTITYTYNNKILYNTIFYIYMYTYIQFCYGLNVCISPLNLFVEMLLMNVTVLRSGAFGSKLGSDEVKGGALMMELVLL